MRDMQTNGMTEMGTADAARWLPFVIVALFAAGCNRSGTDRCSVTGMVTMSGQPVDGGNIQFEPLGPNQASASGAMLLAGRYTVPRETGLLPGRYRVRIYWPEKASAEQGPNVPVPKERVSARFNVSSELTADVRSGSENTFDFAL